MSNSPTENIFGPDPAGSGAGLEAEPATDQPEPSRPVRIGTVVWGLILAVLGALMVIARQASIQLDPAQVAIWVLLGAGLAMVIGGIASAATRRK